MDSGHRREPLPEPPPSCPVTLQACTDERCVGGCDRVRPKEIGHQPIDHWNYRIFLRRVHDSIDTYEDEFTIREAYYATKDAPLPHSWSAEPSHPSGETKHELMEDVTAMAAAISSPVVAITEDGSALAEDQPKRKGTLR